MPALLSGWRAEGRAHCPNAQRGGARGRTGLVWGGRHHSESDEYCTARGRTMRAGAKPRSECPRSSRDGERKVGRIVPMRSGVGPGGRTGVFWGGRHHSESDEYCTARGRTMRAGAKPRSECPRSSRGWAGGNALGWVGVLCIWGCGGCVVRGGVLVRVGGGLKRGVFWVGRGGWAILTTGGGGMSELAATLQGGRKKGCFGGRLPR